MKKICQWCGKEFEPADSRRKYCSEECRKKGAQKSQKESKERKKAMNVMHLRVCPHCGTEFTTNIPRKTYCSKSCYEAERNKRWREKAAKYRAVAVYTYNCQLCGKEFQTHTPGVKYCSVECRKIGQMKKFHKTVNAQKAYRTSPVKAQARLEKNTQEERKRLGDWYCNMVDKNAEAKEVSRSYGQANAPKVEVFVPKGLKSYKERYCPNCGSRMEAE